MIKEFIYELDFHLCLRCGKKFKHRGLLNRHLKNKNPCIINYIKCSRLDLLEDYYTIFYNNINIIKNKILLTTVSKTDGFVCNYCGKSTKTVRGLGQHIQKYCLKNKKLEYRYDNVIKSMKETINNYTIFMKHYDDIKTGTHAVYHPSVVELVNKSALFKGLTKIVTSSVPADEISNPTNYYGNAPKIILK
jgi:hypothetical protein